MRYKGMIPLLFVMIAALLSVPLSAQTVDDFNRTSLGSNWTADPEYVLVSNTLDNSATTASWGYLAVYNAVANPTSVAFTWAASPLCDTEGANSGAIALYLDAQSVTANGYAVMRRYGTLDLHPVINGVMDRATSLFSATPTQANPAPGSTIKVIPSTDASGHHFDFYINNVFDARLTDAAKRYGNASTLYSGVILYGSRTNNIDNFTVTMSTTSTLTVTSPNGGETWYAGSHHNITWTSTNFTDNVAIELSTDGGSTFSTVIAASAPNTGTYDWTVTTFPTLPKNSCRIRVSSATNTTPRDVSNSNFTIGQAQIPTVTAPNGGEIWIANTARNITWSGFTSANVRIRYRIRDIDPWTDITSSTANDGTYEWTVPAQFTETAKIKVSDPAEILESDENDAYFSISAYAKLTVADASGGVGTTGNVVYLWMNNQINIRGIFFDLVDNANYLTAERVNAVGRASGFTVSSNETRTRLRVAMVHMSGQVIPTGNGVIAQINYATDGSATVGTHSTMTLENVTISDANGKLVSPQLVSGNFYYVRMGNVTGIDGVVNADDLNVMRDLVLKRRAPTGDELMAGDMDHDGDIDLFDYMAVFNIVYPSGI
ncbi:MAG TPA: dockerin type I repeat-containing protein [bacterium]|nr:dockerin type I repeat-containing protein [bacterium]